MSDPERPNPDVLLAALRQNADRAARGRLKVFLGMAPGVGKTYAMLEAARREAAAGRDVVIGYVETHGRAETEALTAGLTLVPRRVTEYRGVALAELDLDAVQTRRPALALVDEFAHTNAPGARHPKRYQDILELLAAGIDVFTTLNVQHLESRAEAVRQITGVTIRETVPDTALEGAEFELVDLPPDELRARLAAGKVYVPAAARAAQEHFFRPGNLSALRELALRYAAEQVGQDVLAYRQVHGIADPWKSGQRLLVAVSPSPSSEALVRWACRLAGELRAPWLAVSVERATPLPPDDQARVARHLAAARELGAEVIVTSDEDIVAGLLRVAREHNVTQLVVGKPAGWRGLDLLRGGSILNRLIRESGHIDVHAVRAEGDPAARARLPHPVHSPRGGRDYATAFGVVAGVTALNALLQAELGYQSLALIYLLSVVGLALTVPRGPALAAATVTALVWNFLFVQPRFTIRIGGSTDLMLFGTYFVVALAMGQLTARLRAQQLAERRREERATALYLLTREFAGAVDFGDLLAIAIRELGRTFRADVAIALAGEGADAPPAPYFASTWTMDDKEQSVMAWAWQRRQPAGRGTDTLPLAGGLHLPLVAADHAVGVLSLRFREAPPVDPAQRDLLEAFVHHVALVLDRQRLREAEQRSRLLAESERLSRTLLNSISHEIRTPIAAIAAAAGALAEAPRGVDPPLRPEMAGEIQEAVRRLNRLVGNLLDMTRLETGHVRPRPDWCDVADLIGVTLRELGRELAGHPVTVAVAPQLPLVRLDFVLTQQVLTNLLLNAALHTPAGTPIEVRAEVRDRRLTVSVTDAGPGLPVEALPRLFDKFYRAPAAAAGGTGLGLSIARGFTEAQGGTIRAANRPDGGARFVLEFPADEPPVVRPESERE